jgi:phenylacetic acid degradation operon negative regulatory protein
MRARYSSIVTAVKTAEHTIMAGVTSRALDLATPSTRGNSFITDIAVTFLLDGDPWLPTAAWVRMLTSLDLPSATARTSLHRMDKGGYLDRLSRGGVPGYAMSERWQAFVVAQPDVELDTEAQTGWALVTFSVPETQRDRRHDLRTLLERLGMAPLGNGVWIGPEVIIPAMKVFLEESELSAFTDVFLADYQGFRENSAALARRCWDLDAIAQGFAAFLSEVEKDLARPTVSDEEAFVSVVSRTNALRRLDTAAPYLPSRMFPPGGSRPAARDALDRLVAQRLPAAQAWVRSLR